MRHRTIFSKLIYRFTLSSVSWANIIISGTTVWVQKNTLDFFRLVYFGLQLENHKLKGQSFFPLTRGCGRISQPLLADTPLRIFWHHRLCWKSPTSPFRCSPHPGPPCFRAQEAELHRHHQQALLPSAFTLVLNSSIPSSQDGIRGHRCSQGRSLGKTSSLF